MFTDDYSNYIEEFLKNGELLYNMGQFSELASLCHEFLGETKNEKVYAMLSSAEYTLGDIEAAEKSARNGLMINSKSPENLFNLACILKEKGVYANALRYFYRAERAGDNETADACKDEIIKLEKLIGKKAKELMPAKAKKRVLIIAAIFPPGSGSGAQRTVKLVKYLRYNGWEPIVATLAAGEKQKYPGFEYFDELPDGIEVIRIPEKETVTQEDIGYMKDRLLPLLSSEMQKEFLQLYGRLTFELQYELCSFPEPLVLWAFTVAEMIDKCTDIKTVDLIYSTSGPYSDHVAAYYINQLHNKPWVADFRDEWSSNPTKWQSGDSFIFRMSCDFEKTIINTATKVIHVTERSLGNYLQLGFPSDKLSCITNGFDEEDFDGIDLIGTGTEKFVLVHNGLLYLDRSPMPVLLAIRNLIKRGEIDSGKIRFHMGCFTDIDESNALKREIKKMRLETIAIVDNYMEHRESLLLAATAGLLVLLLGASKDYASMYPAKIFEYLRLKKPVLSLGPSGSIVEELLKETGTGINIEFSDVNAIEKEILKRYRAWHNNDESAARKDNDIYVFERRKLVAKHAEVFDRAVQAFEKASASTQPEPVTLRYDEYSSNCIGCDSDKTTIEYVCNQSKFASNYGVLNPIRVWKRCEKCGLVFAGNMPSADALSTYYSKHYFDVQKGGGNYSDSEVGNLEGYLEYSENRLKRIEGITGGTGYILDVGAGRATFIKAANQRGWQTHGLESSPDNVEYAKSKWGIELDPSDFFSYSTNDKYDVITMLEVIEHLVSPWDAIKKCASLLVEDGLLVIATPFRDSSYVKAKQQCNDFWWSEPSHLTYMDTKALVRRAEKYGFNCIDIVDSEQGAGRLEVYLKL
jgi:SAM-dependent methyltransferase